jgi:uncharacterized protein YkwD
MPAAGCSFTLKSALAIAASPIKNPIMALQSGQRPTPTPAGVSADLRLVPIDPTAARELALGREEISVGSAPDNKLVLAGTTVSRHHAVLARNGREYRVTDLGSTNGTYVNGRRIRDSATVRSGDEIRFGAASYILRDLAAAAAGPVSPRSRWTPTVMLGAIALAFAFSFGLAEFLLNFDRLERVTDSNAASADSSGAISSAGGSANLTASPAAHAKDSVADAAASAADASAVKAEEPPPSADVMKWLGPLNNYRAMAGLPPVTADAKLSQGDYLHSLYLVRNYGEEIRKGVNLGAQMHAEQPGKPWYTSDGSAAAKLGDVDEMWHPNGPPSPTWAIDNWMQVPFHRMTILNPGLHAVGYGSYCEGAICVASLNVLSDADSLPSKPLLLSKPVLYPPDGSSMRGWNFSGEWPDPLTSCPGYDAHAGMPITLQLGAMYTPALSHYALTKDGAPLEVCGFDANTYSNPDAFAQNRARDGLRNFGAIVLIPRTSLTPGAYSVSITTADHTYSWSFTIEP